MAPYRFVVVALLIGGVVAPAASQALATYDDFAGPAIDPARWRGYEHVVPGTHWRRWRTSEFVDGPAHPDEAAWYAQNTERRREIVGGRLHLGLTTWGMRDPYPGDWKTKPKGRIGVRLADVALADGRPPIRTMAADVTLTSVKTISTCDEATPKGGAGILGAFFNDGSSGSRDSRVGDIVVSLTASAAPGSDDVTVGGEIKRCIAEDCSAIEHLTGRAFDLTWPRGTRLTLRIAWQPEQSRFRLSVRGGDRSDTLFLTYPSTMATQRPVGYVYDLRLDNQPGACHWLTWMTVIEYPVIATEALRQRVAERERGRGERGGRALTRAV